MAYDVSDFVGRIGLLTLAIGLAATAPRAAYAGAEAEQFSDPRIEDKALPRTASDRDDFKPLDVIYVWRVAKVALAEGCPKITWGDVDPHDPDRYFVTCEWGPDIGNVTNIERGKSELQN